MGRLVYDAHQIEIDDSLFLQSAQDQWNNFYPDAEELLPPKMPKTKRLLCEYQEIYGYRSCWYFENLEVSINLFEELSDDLVFEATKYCRIFEFWIQICDVENCY